MNIVTWDEINKGSGVELSNGNLTAFSPNRNNVVRATEGKFSGKWYWEIHFDESNAVSNGLIGIINRAAGLNSYHYTNSNARYYRGNGAKHPEDNSYGSSWRPLDIISIALDLDSGTIEFFKNGESQGISHTDVKNMGEVFPAVATTYGLDSTTKFTGNFGATPFQYEIPKGYRSYDNNQPELAKTLILSDGEYKKYGELGWEAVSSTLPDQAGFEEHGMDDLANLDRAVQSAGSYEMIDDGSLGEGKIFKGTVDLKKYFDLRKLEVK